MEQLLFIETGMGIDVHGQDINVAAERAIMDAIHYNSMPGMKEILPGKDLNQMKVTVKLAIPQDRDDLDVEKVKSLIPYGTVVVQTEIGGMVSTSGIELEEQNDQNDLMYIVIAVIEVGY